MCVNLLNLSSVIKRRRGYKTRLIETMTLFSAQGPAAAGGNLGCYGAQSMSEGEFG